MPQNKEFEELIRGALLHDYFLYDRHEKTEQDIIKRHMFPLTPIPPRTRCGWMVCFYDKVAAIYEYCGRSKSYQYC